MAARYNKFKQLLRTSRELNLSFVDALKLYASYYVSRLGPVARRFAPEFVVVHATYRSKRIKIPLRCNGVDCSILSEIFLDGMYDVERDDVRTILDLGANIGLSTLYLSIRHPGAAIASVEPMTANVKMLRQTIALNALDARVVAAAIGTHDGIAELALSAVPTVHSLVPGSAGLKTVSVPQISVPSVMATLGWTGIDLLKIDIEGYEKTLFGGDAGWLASTMFIVGEAHAHVGYRLTDIERDLAPYGFVVQRQSEDPEGGMIIFTARRRVGEEGV